MAQKRMFDKAIIDTDKFMDMGLSSKALYFLLGMEADDYGFVSYKKVVRIHGGNEDDIKVLLAKGFIIQFESGVVVITHWNQNNYLDKNRIKETEYKTEHKLLVLTENGKYVLNNGLTSIEEYRVEESSIDNTQLPKNQKTKKPTLEEVSKYCSERVNNVDPQKWYDYYESNGWKVGRNSMKDWKAAVRTWERNNFSTQSSSYQKGYSSGATIIPD